MSTRYYVEADVTPCGEADFLDVEKALGTVIDEGLTADIQSGAGFASWHGWMDVFTKADTPGAHDEIVTAVRRVLPDAQVQTRWLNWEDIAFDATHDTSEPDND